MSDTQPTDLRQLRAILGRRKVVLILALVITSLVITGFVWLHKDINIIVDGKNIQVSTFHNSVKEVLQQADINLGPKDEYRLSTPNLENGTTIKVSGRSR